jgi:hypothetical protein
MLRQEVLEFSQFSFDKLEGMKKAYMLCFNLNMEERYFHWKYRENPAGEVVAYTATDGDTVAAFYGVMPELYLINGEPVKVYQSMDTMTHPDYQRRGLFSKLAKMTYDHLHSTEKNFTIVGIPGVSSYPGFVNKLNWKDIHHFRYMFLPQAVYKMHSLFRRKDGFEIRNVTEMDVDIATFLERRSLSDKPIQPYLFNEFFNWRVFKNITNKYEALRINENGEMVGLCLFSFMEKKRCFVYFLSYIEATVAGEILESILRFLFYDLKAEFVYTWEPLDPFLNKTYQRHGFLKNPIGRGPFSYEIPLIIYAKASDAEAPDWYNIGNYDLQPLMQD